MAVYRREYEQYRGPLTPTWSRFLILPRFAFQNVFSSKWMTAFFVFCFLPTLVFGALIYLRHSVTFVETFGLRPGDFFRVDGTFFLIYWAWQAPLTFVLTTFVGPGLVSPDLSNNALPLYLCRPFSRSEYVLGKMSVLLILLSSLTWIPGISLMVMHAGYEGWGWLIENARLPIAMFVSSWIWITLISLLALALSAWVKWRPVAGAMLFGVFFVLFGFGNAINGILFTNWGHLISLPDLIVVVLESLFLADPRTSIPVWSAVLSLLGMIGICLWLLNRRVRAYEVIR